MKQTDKSPSPRVVGILAGGRETQPLTATAWSPVELEA